MSRPDLISHHFDILIVGAGVSGIGSSYYLKSKTSKTFAVLEKRSNLGGTWDYFQYPGFRNDSSMNSYAFSFHPWTKEKFIVNGSEVLSYLNEVVDHHNLRSHIKFNVGVKCADFNTKLSLWTVKTEEGDVYTCHYLVIGAGYYDYSGGYFPSFPNIDLYKGEVVHSQSWTSSNTYAGKRVALIGSGATAVTVLPALVAGGASHVTMIQRSPGYIVALRSSDDHQTPFMRCISFFLGNAMALLFLRNYKFWYGYIFYFIAVYFPKPTKNYILNAVKNLLGATAAHLFDPHFIPAYNPWEQRICLSPDGDFYKAVKNIEKVTLVTDHISTFTATGVTLTSGATVEADLFIVATGLQLKRLGGIVLTVDGTHPDPTKTMLYKGFAPSNIPNCAVFYGYLNSSWTLRVDLVANYIVRLLKYMDSRQVDYCVPYLDDSDLNGKEIKKEALLRFKSGYILRAKEQGSMPWQGSKSPWRLHQNYVLEYYELKIKSIDDGVMIFTKASECDKNLKKMK